MSHCRTSGWFVALAAMMTLWAAVLGFVGATAEAGVIGSRPVGAGKARDAEIAGIQRCLEERIVAQRLADYGVAKEDAVAKIGTMSDEDLHRLAALSEKVAAGAGELKWYWHVLIFVVLLAVILLIYANNKPEQPNYQLTPVYF